MTTSALQFQNVTKTFAARTGDVRALDDLTVDVRHGTITALVGPDGAGKTTLLRLAAGLLRADNGTITVLGIDVGNSPRVVQSTIGYMPQHFGLYEDLTVAENLELYADLQGIPRRARSDRFRRLLQMTGLEPFPKRMAGRLSGGMKQKLGLACTLLRSPRLLLLDEPTVGVDPVSRRELWQLIQQFVAETETTVVLSTAYLDEAERCNDIIVLDEGHLVDHRAPSDFLQAVEDRIFHVVKEGWSNRQLLERLAGSERVVDAVMDGDEVRVVRSDRPSTDSGSLWPELEPIRVTPVAPRFEDALIDLLRQRRAEAEGRNAASGKHGGEDDVAAAGTLQPDTPTDAASEGESSAVIDVRNVVRKFGDFTAVRDISFAVRRGEVFGLLGANGAGKTTTFRMLCGLLPPTSGRLTVAGIDVRRAAAAARARIGYMAQKFSLYGTLNVRENLAFFSRAYGLAGARRRRRVDWAIDEFQLAPVLGTLSHALPLGYQQRLAFACALMHEPDILFLDEPTSGVDPLARREFWHRIDLLAARRVTVLVTTHFMAEAEYCDRLAIMLQGRILALGSPTEIRRRAGAEDEPAEDMEEAFIALLERESQHPEAVGR